LGGRADRPVAVGGDELELAEQREQRLLAGARHRPEQQTGQQLHLGASISREQLERPARERGIEVEPRAERPQHAELLQRGKRPNGVRLM